jgi:NADPH:quinone reductase-like Zn-dependent oxidoreductase
MEFAGEVDELGEDVTDWRVGDRVFGLAGGGSQAEYLVAHTRTLAAIPSSLTFEQAAATPEAFITAFDAMVSQARLGSGEYVLIHAVGSGVGTAAVQIARAIGARSIGTARTESKLERARSLGLDAGVVAKEGQFSSEVLARTGPFGVDVILELVGGGYFAEDLACASQKGRIVLVGTMAGAATQVDLGTLLRKRLTVIGTMLRSRPIEEKIEVTQTFAHRIVPLLLPLLASGALKPIVDRTFPLSEAGKAHAYMETNQGFGKIVLLS